MGARSYHSSSSTSSAHSNYTSRTQDTAPTVYSERRPSLQHYDTCPSDFGYLVEEPQEFREDLDRRASIDTYASTIASEEDLAQQPRYEVPSERHKTFDSDATPSTPPEFAELFPSTRRLLIRHDDSTSDGNMNLRVDTEVSISRGQKVKMTLFHLRMRDLAERQFSLRRYCRDSGREVCHSAKKYTKPAPAAPQPKRPRIQRSLTSALQTLTIGKKSPPRPHDLGYGSDDGAEDVLQQFTDLSEVKPTVPTNTIRLEFSNYAQVEVQRYRSRTEKTYDFEYWGSYYRWSKVIDADHPQRPYFYLINMTNESNVAQILPERLSRRDTLEEEYQGSWVPPCIMEITDRSVSDEMKTDLADVIVATGLIALTDDCIKRRWHSSNGVRMSIPRKGARHYIEPGQLVDEVFHRQAPGPRIHQPRTIS